MKVIKNINNNVAFCVDDDNNELIVFAKGVGFKKPPYDIELTAITKTYYNIDESFIKMIQTIPDNIIKASEEIVEYAEDILQTFFQTNLIFTLADHINFAIDRYKNNIRFSLPISYDIQHLYKQEYLIGQYAIKMMKESYGVELPDKESIYIALHIINAVKENKKYYTDKIDEEFIIEITAIIEREFSICIRKENMNYSRFVSHMYYLLIRVKNNETIESENEEIFSTLLAEYPKAANCADLISKYMYSRLKVMLTNEEKIYMILHINRLCAREDCYQ
ncbi:PRD domain-containing protein [Enterococcus avium]|uniref:PRD domain-containing protein n=1 Tax=Enterococcus avium TaxID=33945 RepID=UPI003D6ABBB7